ncbi:MAG: hypothetical protein ACXW2E_03135 [Nitrososphaeraceae archaeon]
MTFGEMKKFVSDNSELSDDTPIQLVVEYGRGCVMVSTENDIDTNVIEDEDGNEQVVITISGTENDKLSEI